MERSPQDQSPRSHDPLAPLPEKVDARNEEPKLDTCFKGGSCREYLLLNYILRRMA